MGSPLFNKLQSFDPGKQELYVDLEAKEAFLVDTKSGKAETLTGDSAKLSKIAKQDLKEKGAESAARRANASAEVFHQAGVFLKNPSSLKPNEIDQTASQVASGIFFKGKFQTADKEAVIEQLEGVAVKLHARAEELGQQSRLEKFSKVKMPKEQTNLFSHANYRSDGKEAVAALATRVTAGHNDMGNSKMSIGQDFMRFLGEDNVKVRGLFTPQWNAGESSPGKQIARSEDLIKALMNELGIRPAEKQKVLKDFKEQVATARDDQAFAKQFDEFFEGLKQREGLSGLVTALTLFDQEAITSPTTPFREVLHAHDIRSTQMKGVNIDIQVENGKLTATWKQGLMDNAGSGFVEGGPVAWQLRFDLSYSIDLKAPQWEFAGSEVKVGTPFTGGDEEVAGKIYQSLKMLGYDPKVFVCPSKAKFGEQL